MSYHSTDDAHHININKQNKIMNPTKEHGKKGWLHCAHTQMVVLGICALLGPGLFNALTSLGGAGGLDPSYANLANCVLYITLAVVSPFGPIAFQMAGNRVLIAVGCASFAVYAMCMYIVTMPAESNSIFWPMSQFVSKSALAVFGGVTLGAGAALFWNAQGAMTMAYSTPKCRGGYISTFSLLFNFGALLGGWFTLYATVKCSTDTCNISDIVDAMYFCFTAGMIAGVPMAIIFLVKSNEVIREDNTRVNIKAVESDGQVMATLSTWTIPAMRRLALMFVCCGIIAPYTFNGVNGRLFSMRARGVNVILYWTVSTTASFVTGKLVLDRGTASATGNEGRSRAAMRGVKWIGASAITTFVVGCVLQFAVARNFDKDADSSMQTRIDIINEPDGGLSATYIFGAIAFMLYGLTDACFQTFTMWLVATVADGEVSRCSKYSGLFKAIQSVTAAFFWGLDLIPAWTYTTQFFVTWTISFAAIVSTYFYVSSHAFASLSHLEHLHNDRDSKLSLATKTTTNKA